MGKIRTNRRTAQDEHGEAHLGLARILHPREDPSEGGGGGWDSVTTRSNCWKNREEKEREGERCVGDMGMRNFARRLWA